MQHTQTTTAKLQVKTIDINAKEWFDKSAANSYFSAQIYINFGMDDCKIIYVPFQYGYQSAYRSKSIEQLQKDGILPNDGTLSWNWFDDNKIIVRSNKENNCLKRAVKEWGSN